MADEKTESTTIIGPTIIIKGRLKSDEDLVVKGRIEAEIHSTKGLTVENSGIIKANVQVKSAKISGVLVGNVSAESRVEIAPDGRVVGDLMAPRIIISDGAAFRGRIDMQTFDSPRDAGRGTQAGAAAHAPAAPTAPAAAAPLAMTAQAGGGEVAPEAMGDGGSDKKRRRS